MTLNKSKCAFGLRSIAMLGHVISAGSKQPDPDRFQTLFEYPVPDDTKKTATVDWLLCVLRKVDIPVFSKNSSNVAGVGATGISASSVDSKQNSRVEE